jgi:hypothetical protein
LLLDIVEPESQRSAVGEGLIVNFNCAPRQRTPLSPTIPCWCRPTR